MQAVDRRVEGAIGAAEGSRGRQRSERSAQPCFDRGHWNLRALLHGAPGLRCGEAHAAQRERDVALEGCARTGPLDGVGAGPLDRIGGGRLDGLGAGQLDVAVDRRLRPYAITR